MTSKPDSKAPYHTLSPQTGTERSPEVSNEFLRSLSDEDRKILKEYLEIETDSFTMKDFKRFRDTYGEQFNILVAGVDELAQYFGCPRDEIREVLLHRMKEAAAAKVSRIEVKVKPKETGVRLSAKQADSDTSDFAKRIAQILLDAAGTKDE